MSRPALAVLLLVAATVHAQYGTTTFPPGTTTFFDTQASAAATAPDGSVWVAAADGLVPYTAAGAGTPITVPGGRPYRLAIAGDGSIWFANATGAGHVATNGTMLEQYPMTELRALAVASDGALWFGRGNLGAVVGRIAAGTVTEWASPTKTWSIAPAAGGDAWILGNGFGTTLDSLYRMNAAGGVTELPLGHDVLFGNLQALPDGTLYVGTGIRNTVLRLAPGSQTFEVIPIDSYGFLVDLSGNLWIGDIHGLRFIGSSGEPRLEAILPDDWRNCLNTAAYAYEPIAADAAGGVWVRVSDVATYIPESLPCDEPPPPPLPDLIRIDTSRFVDAYAHAGQNVPALSPIMLAVLAAALGLAAVWHMRSS